MLWKREGENTGNKGKCTNRVEEEGNGYWIFYKRKSTQPPFETRRVRDVVSPCCSGCSRDLWLLQCEVGATGAPSSFLRVGWVARRQKCSFLDIFSLRCDNIIVFAFGSCVLFIYDKIECFNNCQEIMANVIEQRNVGCLELSSG